MTKRSNQSGHPMHFLTALLWLLLASVSLGQIIGGGVLGGSGGGNPAKYTPTLWLDASQGTWTDAALQLTAADKSWLQIADASQTGLDLGTDDGLISLWVKMDSYTANRVLLAKGGNTSTGYLIYVDTSGKVRIQFYLGGVSLSTAGPTALGTTWHHIAVFFDRNGNASVYLDGAASPEAVLNISLKSAALDSADAFCVGAASASTLHHDGATDSLMFFKATDLSAVAADIISWAYNSGSGRLCADISTSQRTAWGAISGWELGEATGTRYDSWSTNHLTQQFSPIISPPVYGTSLLASSNPGFETVTDAGPPANFGSWTESVGTGGNIEVETTSVHGGTNACKITQGSAGTAYVGTPLVSASAGNYRLSFWTRGDGTNAGRFSVWSNAAQITAVGTTGVTGTNWTLVTHDFTAPSGITGLQAYLYANTAEGTIAYFDTVSLSAITTPALNNGGFEDWTVPSAAELVVNGNFDADIAGWSAVGAFGWNTREHNGAGGMHLACDGSNTPTYCYEVSTALSVTSAAVYRIKYTATKNSGGSLQVAVVAAGAGASVGYAVTHADSATVDTYFTATATDATSYLQLYRQNNSAADWTIDNVSITQVPSNATTWTEAVSGTSSIYREDSSPHHGSHSLAMYFGGTSTYVFLSNAITSGKLYSWSVAAKISAAGDNLTMGGTAVTPTTSFAVYSGTSRVAGTNFLIAPASGAGKTFYLDSVTLTAAEILAAPGIARGRSQDANFAAQLNGSSQYFSYTGTAFNPGTGDFSVGCAFYCDSLAASRILFMGGSVAGSGNAYYMIYVGTSGQVVAEICDGGTPNTTATIFANGSVVAGSWHTLIVNFDRDGNMVGYLNGTASAGTSIATQGEAIATGNLRVGQYATWYHAGRIDNAFYANRLVTEDERTYLENNGEWRQWSELGVAGTDGAALTASVVKGFWEFDNAAALGTDSTSNGANLTPQGTPTQGWGVNYLAGVCSYWADRSGNNLIALMPTLAKRPSFLSIGGPNSTPCLSFDGVDDYMTTTLAGQAAATIFVVGRFDAASDIAVGVLDTANRSYVGSSAADKFAGGVGAQDTTVITSNDDPGTGFFIGSLTYDGDNVWLHYNGNQEYTGAQSGAVSTTRPYFIGANNETGTAASYLDGDIAAILIYPRALTAAQRSGVTSSLAKTYNLTLAP